MNNLISRNAVVAIIEKKRLMVGKHDLSAEYKLAGVQEEIENLPTAYDMDKVVEQLKINTEIAHQKYMDCNYDTPAVEYAIYGTQYHERRKCLDIVKSGGIECNQ